MFLASLPGSSHEHHGQDVLNSEIAVNLKLRHSSFPPTLLRSRTSDSMLSDPSLLQLSNISGDKPYITCIVILSVVDSFVRHPCISWIEEDRIEWLTLLWWEIKNNQPFEISNKKRLTNQPNEHLLNSWKILQSTATKIVKLNTTKLAAFIKKLKII